MNQLTKLPKAIFCWSGGKDSALALHKVLQEKCFDVIALLTTINGQFRRISMHGVREVLLEKQAGAIGLPLLKVIVNEASNAEYERNMEAALLDLKAKGASHVLFGDIFLEDLRAYRELNLQKVGLKAEFPLWKQDTTTLINEFIASGFRTVICCVNDAALDASFAGAELTTDLLRRFPGNVDPCGENGEYHTFCFAGPIFKKPVTFTVGETVYRPLEVKTTDKRGTKGFWFTDLLP